MLSLLSIAAAAGNALFFLEHSAQSDFYLSVLFFAHFVHVYVTVGIERA